MDLARAASSVAAGLRASAAAAAAWSSRANASGAEDGAVSPDELLLLLKKELPVLLAEERAVEGAVEGADEGPRAERRYSAAWRTGERCCRAALTAA